MPITSVVCDPQDGDTVKLDGDSLKLRGRWDFHFQRSNLNLVLSIGYAWSGGGRGIVRVDVSVDLGKTWHVAELVDPVKISRQWAWTRWQTNLSVQPSNQQVEVWVRAVDSSYNTQPEGMEHIWNLRGLMAVGYHKIEVSVKCD